MRVDKRGCRERTAKGIVAAGRGPRACGVYRLTRLHGWPVDWYHCKRGAFGMTWVTTAGRLRILWESEFRIVARTTRTIALRRNKAIRQVREKNAAAGV